MTELTAQQRFLAMAASGYRARFGTDGAVFVLSEQQPSDDQARAIIRATSAIVGDHATQLIITPTDDAVTFRAPQRTWPLAHAAGMVEDPAYAVDDPAICSNHTPEGARNVGAWRWGLLQRYREIILPLIRGKRTIDFGGLAGPVGYDAIVVDHGSEEYRALYDVPGLVETIFTSHTIEHVPDLMTLMSTMWAKLEDGGHVIIQVPYWKREQLRPENWPHHYHAFCLAGDEAPETDVRLDTLLESWADVLLRDDDGDNLLVIARKR